MDPANSIILAGTAVLIVSIVSIAIVVGTIKSARLRAERGLRKDWLGNELPVAKDNDARHASLTREVERLQERVKVLERIATDKGVQLSDQIEELRKNEPRIAHRAQEGSEQ